MDQNPKLRLHIEEDLAREQRWQQRLHAGLPEAQGLADQFEATTGWSLNYRSSTLSLPTTDDTPPAPAFGRFEIADLSEKWPAGKPAVSRVECERLLTQINRLVGKIEAAELERHGAASTLVDATEDSPLLPTNRTDKVANLLRFAKTELSAIGAAVYLLDDATTHLRLRSMIAPAAFAPQVEPVRSLENSLADLESLIGNHVNIHTPEMGETWRIPQPFQYGWCCLLGTKNLPLGTIWIFFSQPRSLDEAKNDFLSNLSNQIYSEISSRENPESVNADSALLRQELILAARSNDARLPSFAPEIEGWKLAGWTYRQGYLSSTFHDWAVTPAGNLSVAVGQVVGPMLTAAMSLNNLRSLISAHRDYRHTGLSLTAKLNEQVWCNSPGDEMASLIYALVDPETDQVQLVNAGDGGVVFGGPFGVQSIDQFQTPLGVDLDTPYAQWERVLQETETLVMFTQGLRHAISESVASASDADLLRPILLRNPGQPQAILAEIEERFFRSDFQHVAGDLSVLVLSRNSAPPTVNQLAAEMSQSILAELRADHENTLEALAKRLEHGDDWDDTLPDYSPIIDVGRQDFDPDWSSDDDSDLAVLDPDADADDESAADELTSPPPAATSIESAQSQPTTAPAGPPTARKSKRSRAKRRAEKAPQPKQPRGRRRSTAATKSPAPAVTKPVAKSATRVANKPSTPTAATGKAKATPKAKAKPTNTAKAKAATESARKAPAKAATQPKTSAARTAASKPAKKATTKATPTSATKSKAKAMGQPVTPLPTKRPTNRAAKPSSKLSAQQPVESAPQKQSKVSAKSPNKTPSQSPRKPAAKAGRQTPTKPGSKTPEKR
jgi:serine phosphatase RsbU (regulator of sigma subunit)